MLEGLTQNIPLCFDEQTGQHLKTQELNKLSLETFFIYFILVGHVVCVCVRACVRKKPTAPPPAVLPGSLSEVEHVA